MNIAPDINIPRNKDAYIVGGSVRDLLLGRAPVDYDIAVLENPEKFARQLAARTSGRLVCIGKPTLMVWRVVSKRTVYDVSPFHGSSIEADLLRRDFSINALACSLSSGRIIDVAGGRRDLAEKKIRMVSPGAFRQDPIRLLRAFRLAADLNFELDPATATAIGNQAHLIRESAGERIRTEIFGLLASADSHRYLEKMGTCGLLSAVLPEMEALRGCTQNRHHREDVYAHTLTAYAHLEALLTRSPSEAPGLHAPFDGQDRSRPALLKWAMLMHDLGKPATRSVASDGRVRFLDHPRAGARIAAGIAARLRLSNREKTFTDAVVRNHLRPLSLFIARRSPAFSSTVRTRFFMACGGYTPSLLLLALADNRSKCHQPGDNQAFKAFVMETLSVYINTFQPRQTLPPLINGHDLIRTFNLLPSPLFKSLLRKIEAARLSGSIQTRAEALAMASRLVANHDQSHPSTSTT